MHDFSDVMIFGIGSLEEGYHRELYRIYEKLDHVLGYDLASLAVHKNIKYFL